MRRFIAITITILSSLFASAFNNDIYCDRIASLQVWGNNNILSAPVIQLSSHSAINITFDDLTHTYHRYTYSITHCEADWSTSEELLTSDYISGFQNGLTIDDYEESINTNTLFTHYMLQIPNDKCSLKMSGNYRVDVIDDDSRDTMFTARFMVVEPLTSISKSILYDTDIDIRKNHQQLSLTVNYPYSLGTTDARSQFRVAVMQNRRYDNMVWCPPAPILRNGTMEWSHTQQLIFPAGNEYHKFEFLDPHRNSMGVEKIVWDGDQYNVHLYHDYPRRAYVYDEDINGNYVIRNSENSEINTTSDYPIVHFYFDSPQFDGDIYIDGLWATNHLSEQYLMEYDQENQYYHIALPLKYGYYNYQYLSFPYRQNHNTSYILSRTSATEGDFYQTENQYTVLVYFKKPGDRTWRLVGYSE